MEKQNAECKVDAIRVDWIVLSVSAIGIAVVIAASVQAGENGLAAHVIDYIATDQTAR